MIGVRANPFRARHAHGGDKTPAQPPCKAAAAPVQEPCSPVETPFPGPSPASALPSAQMLTPWDEASDTERARALMRFAAVERAEALFASGLVRVEADAKAAGEAGVSTSSVAGWRRRARGADACDRAAALLDGVRSGRPMRAWSSDGAEILWTHFLTDYLRLERPEATASWRRTQRIAGAKGWTMPPLAAFLRRLKREVSVPERVRGRNGAVAAMNLYPHVVRTVAGLLPLSIINGDGKEHDVWVRLPSGREGRPHVWYWQDVWSRKILAFAAGEAETARIIQVSLHEVIVTYGVPGKVVIDNTRAASAKEITGGQKKRRRNRSNDPASELPGTLSLLGIVYGPTTVDRDDGGRGVGRGRAKPIERAFGDLCHKIDTDPRLAGSSTGRSPQDRPETHRSKAADWEAFLAVVGECVAGHNARAGRDTQAAGGRSFDDAFNEGMQSAVIRRLSPEQARLLLLDAERVRVKRDGTVVLAAGRTRGQPVNRHYDQCLVERAGETLVARYDPDALRDPVLLHDGNGRFVARAGCLLPAGWTCKQAARDHNSGARRLAKLARQKVEARRDMDALLCDLGQAGPVLPAPVPQPAAVRLVTGKGLPQMPPEAPKDTPGDRDDLLRRIEARRVEFGVSPAGIDLLVLNALGKQVASLKTLSLTSLEALLDLLDNGVTWTEPVAQASHAPVPEPTERRQRGFMAALKHVQQLDEEED